MVTYKVEDVGMFRTPPVVREGKLVQPGVSLEDAKTLVSETIVVPDESTKMINFLMQPGVKERAREMREEAVKEAMRTRSNDELR